MGRRSVDREIVIKSPREEVWRALTQGDRLGAWLGAEVEIDPAPGRPLFVRWIDGTVRRGLIEVVEPPRRLSFRWRPVSHTSEGFRVGEASRVEFLLEEVPTGTRLTVVEEPLALEPDSRSQAADVRSQLLARA